MNTRSGVVIAVVGTVLLSGSALVAQGKGANPNGKPFIELQGQIIEVEGEVASLQDQIDSLAGSVSSMEERLDADIAAIANLVAANTALGEQLAASVSELQGKINLLVAQNSELQARIDANLGDIEALEGQVAYNEGLISAMQQSISDLGTTLQDQIDHNNSLIVALQSEIATIEELTALRELLANGQCPPGQAVREIQPDGSVVCVDSGGGASAGLEVVRVFGFSELVYPGKTLRLVLYCPSGFTATGSGWFMRGFHLELSLPDSSGGMKWLFQAVNENSFPSDYAGYVQCLRLAP